MASSHARTLLPLVDDVLAAAGADLREVDLLAVSIGPGSFTGLRIGLAVVKGLALACGHAGRGRADLVGLCPCARAARRDRLAGARRAQGRGLRGGVSLAGRRARGDRGAGGAGAVGALEAAVRAPSTLRRRRRRRVRRPLVGDAGRDARSRLAELPAEWRRRRSSRGRALQRRAAAPISPPSSRATVADRKPR